MFIKHLEVYSEVIMVKVGLYPKISWEKPTFEQFQITAIDKISLFAGD